MQLIKQRVGENEFMKRSFVLATAFSDVRTDDRD